MVDAIDSIAIHHWQEDPARNLLQPYEKNPFWGISDSLKFWLRFSQENHFPEISVRFWVCQALPLRFVSELVLHTAVSHHLLPTSSVLRCRTLPLWNSYIVELQQIERQLNDLAVRFGQARIAQLEFAILVLCHGKKICRSNMENPEFRFLKFRMESKKNPMFRFQNLEFSHPKDSPPCTLQSAMDNLSERFSPRMIALIRNDKIQNDKRHFKNSKL